MNGLEVWHCGSWMKGMSCCGWLAAADLLKDLVGTFPRTRLLYKRRVVSERSKLNIPTLLSKPLFLSFPPLSLPKSFWLLYMAQTVRRKQKRKQPAAAAEEHPDSTPPAPKRVRVSQAQTARKSTGGREPPPPPRRPGRGGGGDDGGDDDDGDGGGGGGGGGAPRAGPSRQRMWYTFFLNETA